jgi:MFS family permease
VARVAGTMFASLRVPNYRRYFAGALVSNIGTWVSRVAQDWLVLVILTHNSAFALGFITTVQFIWMPLLSPWTGMVADRFPKRRTLMVTQSMMLLTSLSLALLTISGRITLWEVYALAGVQGMAAAFDGPARMTLASEMVPTPLIMNAVSLNSASFNIGRLVGPALGGIIIARWSVGVGMLVNSASFLAVLIALISLNPAQMHPSPPRRGKGALKEAIVYLKSRPDLQLIMATIFCLTMFAMNFQVTNALMATTVFHKGATAYGLLGSMLAVGSLTGALLNARRTTPKLRTLLIAMTSVAVCTLLMALAPSYLLFALVLIPSGLASMTALTTSNSTVQVTSDPAMRGRVMALYMAINQGGAPIGAMIIGVMADHFGVRWALALASVVVLVAALISTLVVRRRRIEQSEENLVEEAFEPASVDED